MPASQPVAKLIKMGSQAVQVSWACFEGDHRGNLDLVQGLVPFNAGGQGVHFFARRHRLPVLALLFGHVGKDRPGDEGQQHQVQQAHIFFHLADALQPHDHLGPHFEAHHRAHQHDEAQFIIDVAEFAVAHGGDQGFARHVGDVGADGKGHGKAQDIQARGHHPGAPHAEEAADNAYPHP